MAGIYIHIPFCKKACSYCNFHFSTSNKNQDELINAIIKEAGLRKDYLSEEIETIYFGGGTPSHINSSDISRILESIYHHYQISADAEITLEANPDDLSVKKLRELKKTGINRFSIGIQSFDQEDLEFLGRVHSSREATDSIKRSQDSGFHNLNIDLIYGIPVSNDEKWLRNLELLRDLNIPHLSAYALTIEARTIYHVKMKQGKLPDVDEEMIRRQFFQLTDFAAENNLLHYEISNFAKEGLMSRHNTNYWRQMKYLGLGPSAHSFDLQSRQWNIAVNTSYIKKLMNGEQFFEREVLTARDKFNEYLMLGLRTYQGCNSEILKTFDVELPDAFYKSLDQYLSSGHIIKKDDFVYFSREGMIMSDSILSSLFLG